MCRLLKAGDPMDIAAYVAGAVIASKPPHDMNDVIDQAAALVNEVKNGSIGKELAGTLEQTRQLMQRSQDAMASIQQDADAIKKLPIVRGYVEDSTSLLVRHTGDRYRQVFAADDLFEQRRAALTEDGKAKLKSLSDWLTSIRFKGSDVVVATTRSRKARSGPATARAARRPMNTATRIARGVARASDQPSVRENRGPMSGATRRVLGLGSLATLTVARQSRIYTGFPRTRGGSDDTPRRSRRLSASVVGVAHSRRRAPPTSR